MKNKFIEIVIHKLNGCYYRVTMPYYFKTREEACLYGEYVYRIGYYVTSYKIVECEDIEKTGRRFYALK